MSLFKKKTSSRKRKSSHTARRSRKPKIKLNSSRVVMLCGVISIACVALLVISVVANSPRKQHPELAPVPPVSEEINSVANEEPSESELPAENNSVLSNSSAQAAQSNASSGKRDTAAESVPAPAAPKSTVAPKNDSPAKTASSVKEKKNDSAASKPNAASKQSVSTAKQTAPSAKPVAAPEVAAPSKNAVPPKSNSSSHQGPTSPVIPYDIPTAQKGATLVFIFDDAGQSVPKVKRYTSLPMPLAIAVLPQLPHSKECADTIRAAKKEVMLHQPMQAENLKINPGPGAITPDMSTFDIAEVLKRNLAEVGPVAGLNNHEGSLITEDEIKIGTVLDVAAEKNIYFVDSRTTATTKAPQAALERDMHIFERDVFLDDVVNRDEVLKQIYRALGIANKKGTAIIIGHVDKSADIIPSLLRDMYPYLQIKGYRFAVPSQLK